MIQLKEEEILFACSNCGGALPLQIRGSYTCYRCKQKQVKLSLRHTLQAREFLGANYDIYCDVKAILGDDMGEIVGAISKDGVSFATNSKKGGIRWIKKGQGLNRVYEETGILLVNKADQFVTWQEFSMLVIKYYVKGEEKMDRCVNRAKRSISRGDNKKIESLDDMLKYYVGYIMRLYDLDRKLRKGEISQTNYIWLQEQGIDSQQIGSLIREYRIDLSKRQDIMERALKEKLFCSQIFNYSFK